MNFSLFSVLSQLREFLIDALDSGVDLDALNAGVVLEETALGTEPDQSSDV